MSEAPGPSDESDFGVPTKPTERSEYGMPGAFPPPQEKTGENSLKGENHYGVGGPSKDKGSGPAKTVDGTNSGADQTSEQTTSLEDRGISIPPELQRFVDSGEEIPDTQPSTAHEQEAFDSTVRNQTPASNNGPPKVEKIQTSAQREEGSQNRDEGGYGQAISQARAAREAVREGRASGTVVDSDSPQQEDVQTRAASQEAMSVVEQPPVPPPTTPKPPEEQTPEATPQEVDSTVSQETPEQTTDSLFQRIRSGKETFQDPDGTTWRSEEKVAKYEEGEPYRIIFKEVGGDKTRDVSMSELQQIADSRAEHRRPEPPTPPPSPTTVDTLNAPPHGKETEVDPTTATIAETATPAKSTTQPSTEALGEKAEATPPQATTEPKPEAEKFGLPPVPAEVIESVQKTGKASPRVRQWVNAMRREDGKTTLLISEQRAVEEFLAAADSGRIPIEEPKPPGGTGPSPEEPPAQVESGGGAPLPPQESPKTSEAISSVEKEPKSEEAKTAEITSLQMGKIDKLLDAIDAKDASEIKKRLNTIGTKTALKEVKDQLGIEARIMNNKGQLSKRFLEELRKAREEERIHEKAPEPKPEQPTTPEKTTASQKLKEQLGKAPEVAKNLGTTGAAAVEKRRVAVVESMRTQAEKTGVGRFLFRQGEAFLNKVDWRDKEIVSWVAGMGFGAASTILIPIPGLSSILRAPLLVGLNLAGTKGLNALRLRSITNALKPYVVDKTTLKETAGKYDASFKLIRGDDKTAFNEEIARLSEEVAAGKPQDILVDAQTIATEALSIQMLQLSEKYANASNHIRSFAAGLSVGSIGGAFLPELDLDIPGQGGGPEDASVSPEAPSPDISFTEPLSPQAIPPEIADTPNAAENWQTFADHWNSLDIEQREDFLNIMSDPDQVASLEVWAEAHSAVAPEFEPVQSILNTPENFTELDIGQGDTVGQLATDSGYTNFWEANPDNAALKGLTIEENRALLEQATKSAADAGLATQALPTEVELVELMNKAAAGDLAANARLNEALHWIPEGSKLKLLNESVLSEAVNKLKLGG